MQNVGNKLKMFAKRALVVAVAFPMVAFAQVAPPDGPLPQNDSPAQFDTLARISDELVRTEAAVEQIKKLRDQKPMTGRGWTALDDIVVGGATAATATGMLGVLYGLPRLLPKVAVLQGTEMVFARGLTMAVAGFGALNLAQGLIVYAFVPRTELGTNVEPSAVPIQAEKIDLTSLNQSQAEALLERLTLARVELEESAEALMNKIAPKLNSRLAFIASNVISAGFALTAIGGGIYFVTSMSGRTAPFLMRMKHTKALGQMLETHGAIIKFAGAQWGLNFIVQGVESALTGLVIKMFVPKNTVQASPVN